MRGKKRWIILALALLLVIAILLARREPTITPGSFLVVDIGGSYEEAGPADPLGYLVKSQTRLLGSLRQELRKAAQDTRLRGVLVKLTPLSIDFAKVQEIRGALRSLRTAGKRVVVWVSGETGSGNREYYLASVADRIYFAENTMLPLLGLRATYLFLGAVWENLEIDMQVEQIREYKTFGDFLSRRGMSTAHREMANSLLDDLSQQFLTDIAQGRQLSLDQVETLVNAPTLTPADFVKGGLIDGIRYYDELLEELSNSPGTRVPTVDVTTYSRVKRTSVGVRPSAKMAVVYGVGNVVTGKSGWQAMGQSMGAETIVKAFEEAARDDTIQAIIFRIDSPGGSALGSDLIWRAVKRASAKKPVIASMSGSAGSGGYYIAAAATKIVAQPATLTGSIGILFSLPNVKGMLTKLGIHTETLERGRYARLFDTSKSWSTEERQQIKRILENLYDTFTAKVAAGRGLSVAEVGRVGRGRVWTGAQARDLGLVDRLGGFDTAIRLAKEAAAIPVDTDVLLVSYPKSERLIEMLLGRLRRQTGTTLALPERWRPYLHYLTAAASQEHIPLLAMPALIHIR